MARIKPSEMYCVHEPRGGVVARVPGHRSKFYAYSKYGKAGAMVKARAYVDKLIDRSRVNPETRRYVRKDKDAGIMRIVRRQSFPGRKQIYRTARWVAEWQEAPGVNRRKEFSVKKYGEAGAKQAAREWRDKKVQEILGA